MAPEENSGAVFVDDLFGQRSSKKYGSITVVEVITPYDERALPVATRE
jgi:hypothetical protein